MFEYSDPAGRDFLGNNEAKQAYLQIMQTFYDSFGSRRNSGFTWLEAFDELASGQPIPSTIDWRAFPLLATGDDDDIDRNRLRFQDEYVEWRVERSGSQMQRIIFTTELPEYFQAFAQVGKDALAAAVKDVIPGARPTIRDLFGTTSNPDNLSPTARSQLFRSNLVNNPWNNGEKGILCLTQRFNTMGALFNLVTECSIEHSSGAIEDTCAVVGGACGVGRSSDPRVCSESQAAARARFGITLRDPAGIRILELRDVWKIDGEVIDINDENQNHGAWKVERNGLRGILDLTTGVTLGDDPITSGSQVSRQLAVGAHIWAAPENSLPTWARTGNEGQRNS